MNKIYGAGPVDLGLIDLDIKEMMFWLYCPIKLPHGALRIPDNLEQFYPLISAVRNDCPGKWSSDYVYITAKRLYVTPDSPGNRPGWHSDGFMTDDLNYVWYDGNPTLFWESRNPVAFTQDHKLSLPEMEATCEADKAHHRTYPNKHLLRLDESVMHRVGDVKEPGFRTFVKVSVSKFEYRLAGNSINHLIGQNWTYEERGESRNAPEVAGYHAHAPAPSPSEPQAPSTTSHQTKNPSPVSSTKTEGEE